MIPPQAITAGAGAASDILKSLNINSGNRKRAQADAIANRANAQMAAIAAIAQAKAPASPPAAQVPVQGSNNSMIWIILAVIIAIVAVIFIIRSRK